MNSIMLRIITVGLVGTPACGNEVAGAADLATDPTTTGSPTSFTPTDPGEDPTTEGTTAGTIAATTGGESSGTTMEAAYCGDGVVDPDEACDDGVDNGVFAACTDECQVNVCGDGKVHAGVEECDEAAANVDTGYCRSDCLLNVCGDGFVFVGVEECDGGAENGPTYGRCDEKCTINRCGDGELDAELEQCDAGELNGSGAPGEDGMAGCGLDCGFAGRRLFLSSKLFTGDMGSRAGADLACQVMAEAAKFPNASMFRALLADSQGSPNTFVANDASGLPYIAPSGMVLAASYPELISQGPGPGVITTEMGEVMSGKLVWTNVGPFGDAYLVDPEKTCADWTSGDVAKSARVGINAVGPDDLMDWQNEHRWLSHAMKSCSISHRIYCIEVQ